MSMKLIEPYVLNVFGASISMTRGNLTIMILMLGLVLLFPFSLPGGRINKEPRIVDPYLSGVNHDEYNFYDSFGQVRKAEFKNYYLEKYFNEAKLLKVGYWFSGIVIVLMLIVGNRI